MKKKSDQNVKTGVGEYRKLVSHNNKLARPMWMGRSTSPAERKARAKSRDVIRPIEKILIRMMTVQY